MGRPRTTRSTYRLQLTPRFGFDQAREVVPYLDRLGITDVYCSPILAATSGSEHGYDVVDPTSINPELGGENAFGRFASAVHERGMGLLLDIVPNHMAISPENRAWMDVLKRGPDSPYARWFDLTWPRGEPYRGEMPIRVPVLGAPLDDVLANGELQLTRAGSEIFLTYHEWRFPINIGEMASVPGETTTDPDRENLLIPPSRFHDLLERQHYRLAHWREAFDRVSYRRFFDITHLIGVRVEDPDVFRETHEKILQLIGEGLVTGLRIDHIDGLTDPAAYLSRLQNAIAGRAHETNQTPSEPFPVLIEKILEGDETIPPDWPVSGTTGYDFLNALPGVFIDPAELQNLARNQAEIAGIDEPFAERVIAAKREAARTLFPGEVRALTELLAECGELLDVHGPAESLSEALLEVSAHLPVYRTYLDSQMISRGTISDRDRHLLETSLRAARQSLGDDHEVAVGLIERVFSSQTPSPLIDRRSRFMLAWQQFTGPLMAKGLEDTTLYRDARLVALNEVGVSPAMFDQPPEMIAFHEHNQRIARDWPDTMTTTATHDTKRSEDMRARLYAFSESAPEWRHFSREWLALNEPLRRQHHGETVPDPRTELFIYQTLLGIWPLESFDRAELTTRITDYIVKAAREAKERTSWTDTNEEYEAALTGFIRDLLDPATSGEFLEYLEDQCTPLAYFGMRNSLAQVLLKIASPGVPDFYQGTELWDFSLVDPDNRRPVDFPARQRMLESLPDPDEHRQGRASPDANVREMLEHWRDGRIKQYVMHRGLRARQRYPHIFTSGSYLPVRVAGPHGSHVCAFLRTDGEQWILAAAAVRIARMAPWSWNAERLADMPAISDAFSPETHLTLPAKAPLRWRDELTGAGVEFQAGSGGPQLSAGALFNPLPVALLSARH